MERIRKLWKLNREVVSANIERRKAIRYHPSAWDSFPEKVWKESEPVFFLSTGRCGTQLVTRIIEQQTGVLVMHKPTPEFINTDRWAYELGDSNPIALQAAFRAARYELLADATLRGRKYIETNQRVTFFAPAICSLLPKARFVHLVRDPVKFISSAVRLGFYEGYYTDTGRIHPISGAEKEAWSEFSSKERAAWLWNETNTRIERFKETADPSRWLMVKSEELFADPAVVNRLLEFCGLEQLPAKEVRKLINVRVNRKESRKNVTPASEWDEHTRQLLEALLPLAHKYGYRL